MIHRYGLLVVIICILIFLSGYFVAVRQQKITQCKLETKYKETIKMNLDEYNKVVNEYKSQVLSLQQNNITTVKTVYLPSGQKIVTKIVDKSVLKHTEDKVTQESSESKKTDISQQIVSSSTSSEIKKPTLSNYKIGLLSPIDDFKNVSLTGGVRLGSLPILLTVQAPPDSTFYKKLSVGAEFEF